MRLSPGDVVDRFEVVDLLGAGGIAEVYRVRHRVLGSIQALKVVTAGGTGVARRLVREGSIQAQLRHPNVVAVTDVIEVAGCTALVMEFVEGITLERLLAEDGGLAVDTALALFAHVLAGVAAAHDAGVLHRDLKPGNVLLSPGATGVTAKVADFGIAKVLVDEPGPQDTLHGLMMGTPGYMAPEQIGDAGSADARADVYALGAILYEMLAGIPVFPRKDVTRILQATLRGEIVPLADQMPGLSGRIARTVDRCLALDRDERFPDATAIAADLYADRPDLLEVVTGVRVGVPVAVDLPEGVTAPVITASFRTPMVQSAAANPTLGPDAFTGASTIAPAPPPRVNVGAETRMPSPAPPPRAPSRRWLMSGFGLFAAAMLVVFVAPKLAPRADRAPLPEDVAVVTPGPAVAPVVAPGPAPGPAPAAEPVAPAPALPSEPEPAVSGAPGGVASSSSTPQGTKPSVDAPTTEVASTRADDTPAAVEPPPPAPPPATTDAVAAVEPVSPAPAASSRTVTYDTSVLVGTWRGTWDGRPMTILLTEAEPGRLNAKLEVFAGTYRTYDLSGPVDTNGRFTLAEATTPGWWLDGALGNGVLSGKLARPGQAGTTWTAKRK